MVNCLELANGYLASGGSMITKIRTPDFEPASSVCFMHFSRSVQVAHPNCDFHCQLALAIVNDESMYFGVVKSIWQRIFDLFERHRAMLRASSWNLSHNPVMVG